MDLVMDKVERANFEMNDKDLSKSLKMDGVTQRYTTQKSLSHSQVSNGVSSQIQESPYVI